VTESSDQQVRTHFIQDIINDDIASGKHEKIHTRFPPEPNGYLHIGHAKSICLNFGLADEYKGVCNLRFDDTNPIKEEDEYVRSIKEDVRWLGFDWEDRLYYGSDFFQEMYDLAEGLIEKGKAFVCDLNSDEMREYRGTLKEPGKNSPFRDRSKEENLDLFRRMKAGEFPDGSRVLRAKIDMSHPNLNMRDPIMYRILNATHHRTGDKWCIYPMYDWAHGLEDSMEKITHSLCTLEFEDHRPLYDWFLEQLDVYRPQQIEFAPLNISYTILSKRKLLQLVSDGFVSGWDDPRMPTLSGLRRRGYTPASIKHFIDKVGVAKRDSIVDLALLEHSVRNDLNKHTNRVMGVLNPLKITITNFPEDESVELSAINNPEDESAGKRKVLFTRELFIEREDFQEDPPKKFFRLAPGREVRLRYAFFITCQEAVKDPETGEIIELLCTYDPETKGGNAPDGRKVKATLHWVSAKHALDAEIRIYDRLFMQSNPNKVEEGQTFLDNLNNESMKIIPNAKVEPSITGAEPGQKFQFERKGYFCVDPDSADSEKPIFNLTVTLRDSWAKRN